MGCFPSRAMLWSSERLAKHSPFEGGMGGEPCETSPLEGELQDLLVEATLGAEVTSEVVDEGGYLPTVLEGLEDKSG